MKVINVVKFIAHLRDEIATCDELCTGFQEIKDLQKAFEYHEDAVVFREFLEACEVGMAPYFEDIEPVVWHDISADPYDLPDEQRSIELVLDLPSGFEQIHWNSRTKFPTGTKLWCYTPTYHPPKC